MKIELKTRLAGPGGIFDPGSVIDLEKGLAEQLVNGGYALSLEPIEEPKEKPKKRR